MNNLQPLVDPIEIINANCHYTSFQLEKDFLLIINKLYQYEIFKPYLDFVATICKQGRLRFEIQEKAVFHFTEGTCKTFETFSDSYGNSIKRYIINIKKVMPDVIIHEISHMMENELNLDLDKDFLSALKTDLSFRNNFTPTLYGTVKAVITQEVSNYPNSHHSSEFFARILQLFAMSREIMGRMANNGYSIVDMYKAFGNIERWMHSYFFQILYPKIDPNIAHASIRLQKPLKDIVHAWADEAVKSLHKNPSNAARKWGNMIKSVKN